MTNDKIKLITMKEKFVIIVTVILIIAAGVWAWKNFYNKPAAENKTKNQASNLVEQVVAQGLLKIEDLKIGDGQEAHLGNTLSVHYLGTFTDGIKFDSSYDRGQPFSFQIGANKVIPGWELGTLGMKVGGKRKLTIAPPLAYGDQAVGAIPANSTLIFEIELLEIK